MVIVVSFYKEFLASSFDNEFGTIVGIPTQALYFLMLVMIALTVVLLIRMVGVILVIALLTIPAAMAKQFTFNLKKMMFLAIFFSVVITFFGLLISYRVDVAPGAVIIIFGGIILGITLAVTRFLHYWGTNTRISPIDIKS